ncbi:hypothetical protein J31TS4_33030 [Paenibacillus sp. J31TS4]|nr:hypothetical protein J31TS4_33030 [Paenibacillus sp. J31TS4]
MGVKFGREYEDIIHDLSMAMADLGNCHEFFEMSGDDWGQLEEEERKDCIATLADDVFYGLGAEPTMSLGACQFHYDRQNHLIKIFSEEKVIHMVRLV